MRIFLGIVLLSFLPLSALGHGLAPPGAKSPNSIPASRNLCGADLAGYAPGGGGGFTHRAQEWRVHIKHFGQGAEIDAPLTPDLAVAPGDAIRLAGRHW